MEEIRIVDTLSGMEAYVEVIVDDRAGFEEFEVLVNESKVRPLIEGRTGAPREIEWDGKIIPARDYAMLVYIGRCPNHVILTMVEDRYGLPDVIGRRFLRYTQSQILYDAEGRGYLKVGRCTLRPRLIYPKRIRKRKKENILGKRRSAP